MGCYPTGVEGADLGQRGDENTPQNVPNEASRPNATLHRAISDGQTVGDRR